MNSKMPALPIPDTLMRKAGSCKPISLISILNKMLAVESNTLKNPSCLAGIHPRDPRTVQTLQINK